MAKKFIWVIKDFSSKYKMYSSLPVLIGDCKWYLTTYPMENDTSLCIGLVVSDYESLPSGWRRYVKLRLSVVKQMSTEPAERREAHLRFDQKNLGMGFLAAVPLTEILDEKEGFLVNGEIVIAADVEVLEVIDTSDCLEEFEGECKFLGEMKQDDDPKPCDILNKNQESINVNGFQVLPSQVNSVKRIFERHPDIASKFRSKNENLRKTSMNFLLSLIETLCQSLQELSSEDLVDADTALTYLKDVGFEVDWLERKLDQVKEKKEKEVASSARLLKLKRKCSDLDDLVKEEEAELSATRTPLSFDDLI